MRPQQNRRIRGRNNNNNNNNNRRGPNPLSRNYESNGPDVKIRGNAQHIADKYTALARDAQASGDRVMAENYLQHAEHYVRIILAAQAQMPQPIQRDDMLDDDDEENSALSSVEMNEGHEAAGSGPQPDIQGVPAEVALSDNIGDTEKVVEPKKPRRAPRRRSTPIVEAEKSNEGEPSENEQQDKNESSEAKTEEPAVVEEVVEKKPRRRRTTKPKVEKAEEEV